ncbi:MAG: GNAT family N-acetyltransferase [Candidatus Dadabacteria bacterium]|nr:GNAT family N-acetyltransferase [Candidatus Dadabacteria bacterium]
MNVPKVEPSVPEDFESVAEMEKLCFERDAWPAAALKEEMSGGFARRSTVVRGADGRPVAYCICRTLMNETEIYKLAVHPLHRRRGLAKLLLRDALARAGGGRVMLEVATDNMDAIFLYCGMGFRAVGERRKYYGGSGRDAVVMSLETS